MTRRAQQPRRDCVFLVADKTMGDTFTGFFQRSDVSARLGCGAFSFDPALDLIVAEGGGDPGVFDRAHQFLACYRPSHDHALVALDAAWDSEKNATGGNRQLQNARRVQMQMGKRLRRSWRDRFQVVVIDPELEAWVWQDHPEVAKTLGWKSSFPLRQWMADRGDWPLSDAKPWDPKAAMKAVVLETNEPWSSALHKRIVSRVPVDACVDTAFDTLRGAFQRWFPPTADAASVISGSAAAHTRLT